VAEDPVELWASSSFLDDAQAWVTAELAPRGVRLTGEWAQPHVRVWSSTIRFETTDGRVWFKVNGSGTAYEAELLAVLGDLCPGLAPEVLAHDSIRAWSLIRDGGPVLRSIAEPKALWGYWEQLLPWYAEAQLGLVAHRKRLLATGIPDLAPTQLRLQLRRLLDELAARPVADGGLSREQAAALERLLPTYDDWCTELTGSPVPDSLQHDDLHSNNICWSGKPDDLSSATIIDWGDASVGYPFWNNACHAELDRIPHGRTASGWQDQRSACAADARCLSRAVQHHGQPRRAAALGGSRPKHRLRDSGLGLGTRRPGCPAGHHR